MIAYWRCLEWSLLIFQNYYMWRSSSKVVQKNGLKSKKNIEKSHFFQYLSHSGKKFDQKPGNFFGERSSDLVLSSGAFRSFYFIKSFQSLGKIHWKCQKSTKLFTLSLFAVNFELFLSRSLQIFLWKRFGLQIQSSLMNVCQQSDYKLIQKVHKLHKTKLLNFFDSFGVILKCLWSKTLQRSLQKKYIVRSFVFELIVLERSWVCWSFSEIVQKCHRKRQKLEKLSTIRGHFEVFFLQIELIL